MKLKKQEKFLIREEVGETLIPFLLRELQNVNYKIWKARKNHLAVRHLIIEKWVIIANLAVAGVWLQLAE